MVEGEADEVGDEDADRHRQLEEADQPTTALRWRHLGDVDGGGGGGEADRHADHDTGDDQHLDAGRCGAGQGADDEHRGGEQDHQPPPVAVGCWPGERGPGHGADRHRRDHQALRKAAEVEIGLDEEQRPGDDTGVVAEQQPAEPGDRSRQHHIAARPPPGRLKTVAHPAGTVYRSRGRDNSPEFAGTFSSPL